MSADSRGAPSARLLLPRLLPNLRDAGGLRTQDGGRLRRGRFLRSAALVQLSPGTAQAVTEYAGPACYLDLRTDQEIESGGEPAALLSQGWRWLRVPVCDRLPGDDGKTPADQLRRYLEHWPLYTAAARQAAQSLRAGPVLIGCALGKDRTGLVAALVQRWLGVFPQDIIDDFEFSNYCLARGRHLLPAPWNDPRRQLTTAAGWVCEAALEIAGACFPESLAPAGIGDLRRDLVDPPHPPLTSSPGRKRHGARRGYRAKSPHCPTLCLRQVF
jgi:Tyrosine phosphatase family